MGLFSKKTPEEELLKNLVGGSSTTPEFFELIRINDLEKEFKGKNAYVILEDIKTILKNKVKNGELSLEEIELEFYFLIKQAIYIKNESATGFNIVVKCPYCKNNFNNSRNNLVSCPNCKKGLFDTYIIDYDELDKIKIKLPGGTYSPYRDMGDELSQYILKKKSNSNKYKIDQLLPKCANRLGVSEEECFFVETLVKDTTTFDLNAMFLADDKISYIAFGKRTGRLGELILDDDANNISNFYYNDILHIEKTDDSFNADVNAVNMNENLIFFVSSDNSFSKLLHEKYEAYKFKVDEEIDNDGSENKTLDMDSNVNENDVNSADVINEENELLDIGDVNPMERIKEAKELLDIGAISQEEFDEIKNKYLKFV